MDLESEIELSGADEVVVVEVELAAAEVVVVEVELAGIAEVVVVEIELPSVVELALEVPDDVELVVVDVAAAELVEFAVIVSSATTPLLKSCSLAIKTFIGSIESLGSLHVTVLLMPIFVAVTSAQAPSGFLG